MAKKKKNTELKDNSGDNTRPRLSASLAGELPRVAQSVPVVAVLGHVDHGKTTLLDAIRKTNIAQREHGGITQGIGASSVGGITFIDTPGHKAFTHMRGRGTQAADIGLLVVSLVDGVMPQTKESISLLLETKVPFIVVLTKADLPDKNAQKVKQQLLKEGVMLEGLGGNVPFIEVSAKTGANVKELLELILLFFELNPGKPTTPDKLKGIVIESRLDPRVGPRATVVIKSGTLFLRDEFFCEGVRSRVRTILSDGGEQLKKATVGQAVEVLGFEKVPKVGGVLVKKGEAVAYGPARPSELQERSGVGIRSTGTTLRAENTPMPPGFFEKADKVSLSVVLCADTQGSLEAITSSLPKEVKVVLQKTGEITAQDILFAKSVSAIVLGFNARISPTVAHLGRQEKILIKNYALIYELLSEVADVLEGKQLALEEEIFGKAKVIASFPYEKTKVLGIKVLTGRVAKGDKVRLTHQDGGEEVVGESKIISVRQGKNPISRVEKNDEAGVLISPFLDFTIGDMLICHS